MRRTTICRFDRAALLALVAVPLACWSLSAQDTTQAAAPPATPAQQPPSLQGELPATHTVVRGETLWSLAQQYFNDPLLWPEIYRLNTSLIEDPHWIYPGEVLQVAGGAVAQAPETTVTAIAQGAPDTAHAAQVPLDTLAAAPADTVAAVPDTTAAAVDTLLRDTTQAVVEEPPPPPVEEAYQTIFDRPQSRVAEVQRVLRAYTNQPYHPVRRGEFYSAGFLTEGENLPWGRIVGTTDKPAIPRLTERSTAVPFSRIVIEPPPHASYHIGDSLLVARTDRDEGDWGDVVVPLAVARVVEVAKTQLLAEIVTQFGRVRDGHLTLPLEPFKDPGEARPTTVFSGLTGRVITVRDLHTIANAQQILFIDRGRVDGVVPGDVFQVYTGQAGTPSEELRAVVEIVHTRDHSSSGLILVINNPQLPPGLPVRLIRKMPS
jgi:LysM repeat protein